LKPTSIFDLQAMVALYRPGPMANIPEFIARKHNPRLIKYPSPALSEVLKESYGVITFQDDVLLTAIKVAGYSWADADKLRKAIGKKIPSEMKKQHDKFIEGAVKYGMEKHKAESLWVLFEPFAGYGFNKAHAAGYAAIAYQTAYLKANFPVEFMTALLTAESRGTTGPAKNEKIALAVAECKRLKIKVFPPDINRSSKDFGIENKDNIRFGLSAIKNIGEAAIRSILEGRKNTSFKNLEDFLKRVDLGPVNKKTMESLIKAGAFDSFGNRAALLISYPKIIQNLAAKKRQEEEGQASLFENLDLKTDEYNFTSDVEDFTQTEKLFFEKEFLGIYLSSHPQMDNLLEIKSIISHKIELLVDEKEGTRVEIGGIVESLKKIFTKNNGNEMAFLTIGDEKGLSVECIIFPRIFKQYRNILIKDSVIIVKGFVDTKNDKPTIIAEKILATNKRN